MLPSSLPLLVLFDLLSNPIWDWSAVMRQLGAARF